MQESLAGARDEPVIIAARRGMARFIGDEGGALLHALEDHDNGGVSLERAVVGSDHLLLADTLRRRQDRDPVYGDDRSKSGAAHRRLQPVPVQTGRGRIVVSSALDLDKITTSYAERQKPVDTHVDAALHPPDQRLLRSWRTTRRSWPFTTSGTTWGVSTGH